MEQPPPDPRYPYGHPGAQGTMGHVGAPPPPPGQHMPVGYYYGAPPPNDGKAVTSLVFGILSLVCFGIIAAIPAIVLGLLARRDIERSGGALGGNGLANTGIALGAVSSVISIASLVLLIIPLFLGGMSVYSHSSPSSGTSPMAPPMYAPPSPASPSSPPSHARPPSSHAPDEDENATTVNRGALRVIEPHHGSGSLQRQLMDAVSHAKEKGRGVLVETAANESSASHEFDTSLTDRRMQRALGAVDLVRVDVDEFATELSSLRMYTEAVPYFYKIDAAAQPTDAISADEWDANVPQNMAPVLESFVAGTLRQRRSPSPLGTTL